MITRRHIRIKVLHHLYAHAADAESSAAVLLKKAAGLAKGSGVPNRDKVGKVSKQQVLEIVKTKQNDLNANDEEAACRIIEGTARSMGIEVS